VPKPKSTIPLQEETMPPPSVTTQPTAQQDTNIATPVKTSIVEIEAPESPVEIKEPQIAEEEHSIPEPTTPQPIQEPVQVIEEPTPEPKTPQKAPIIEQPVQNQNEEKSEPSTLQSIPEPTSPQFIQEPTPLKIDEIVQEQIIKEAQEEKTIVSLEPRVPLTFIPTFDREQLQINFNQLEKENNALQHQLQSQAATTNDLQEQVDLLQQEYATVQK
jgi:hypothetical protein